jgi:hypothetical protein
MLIRWLRHTCPVGAQKMCHYQQLVLDLVTIYIHTTQLTIWVVCEQRIILRGSYLVGLDTQILKEPLGD